MTNDPRYDPVAQALPATLPPLTRGEAQRAYRRLVKHFGRPTDAVAWRTHQMFIHPDARRCWVSPKPTANTNSDKGWGRLIHDASHRIFHYLGLLVLPENPPEWFIKQNGRHSTCHVFGAECEESK